MFWCVVAVQVLKLRKLLRDNNLGIVNVGQVGASLALPRVLSSLRDVAAMISHVKLRAYAS